MAKRLIYWLMVLCGVSAGMLVACEPAPQIEREPGVTVAPRRVTLPSVTETGDGVRATAFGVDSEAPADDPPSVSCEGERAGAGIRYDIAAVLDWPSHILRVEQHVTYRNDTGVTQKALVFNVEPNLEAGQFTLDRISTEDRRRIDSYLLDSTRLTVALPELLEVDCEIGIILKYSLVLPGLQDGYSLGKAGYHLGYWGYSARQVNLGMWFPLIAAFDPAQQWVTTRFHTIGEQGVLPTADFTVQITVEGASDRIRVAGPGVMSQPEDNTWRFVLSGGRELALSISEEFRVISTLTADGVKVELYYLADPASDTLDAARYALHTAANALALYEELYGTYPHARLVVVQGDFPDGMEFSGLVFVGEGWFKAWNGFPDDWLTLITVHEVSHQWWYALVGNDQGNYPYIDEALAVYSEVLYLERFYPEYVGWWWDFRVEAYDPTGYVDSTVYDFYSVRSYINAVYLRGALMLDAVRKDIGDDAFFAWLRRYAEDMWDQVATPEDLWGALSGRDYSATGQTRQLYLRQSNILPRSSELP